MQRRATALSVVFFLVISVGAFLLIGVAQGVASPERVNGLWGVSILSGLAAVFLLMLSFLPPRY